MIAASAHLAALCALAIAPLTAAEHWTVFETAQGNGHRLTEIRLLTPAAAIPATTVACDPAQRFQRMEGFGGALTESSGWVLAQLPADQRAEVMRRYYDPRTGIGYTLARTHINSCDFSLGTWALDPVAGDTSLRRFSLAPMRAWVLPLIHAASDAAGPGRLRLLASPWSPPSWMKTNHQMTEGGALIPEYRRAWADYLVRFIAEMDRQEHLPVWALTVQNEPAANQSWESCLYTAAEERDFIRDYLGPALARSAYSGVRLCILDHNRDMMDEWTRTIYSDADAARFAWGTAMHWYVSEDFAAPARAHGAFPDKPTLMTEGCCERSTDSGQWALGRWDHGERYAHSMINDFNHWVCGWIDWNIALDETGGPNHVGNFCDAPVIVDTETGRVTYTPAFCYIGQFSRFIRPGAFRIGSTCAGSSLEAAAFSNPDGSLAVVVLNTGDVAVPFHLAVGDGATTCRIPAHAIQTYVGGPRADSIIP